jgi:putative transposase
MEFFSFQTGLIVRFGSRMYDFVRQLDDDKVQFQEQLTLRPKTIRISECVRDIQTGKAAVVSGESTTARNSHALPSKNLQDLPKTHYQILERRMTYVSYMRRNAITRGEKRRITESIPLVATRIKDGTPPSTDSVMRWMREFEKASLNPLALVNRNLNRKRPAQLPLELINLIDKKLRAHYFQRTRPSLMSAWETIKHEQEKLIKNKTIPADIKLVSRATVWRRAQLVEPFHADKSRFGETFARAKYRTAFGNNSFTRPYQRWECDHTLLDWVIVCDRTGMPLGRPTLTLIVDRFSGYICGFYVSFSGTGLTAVLNTLKTAIQPKDAICANASFLTNKWFGSGLPELLALDNGLEFHSPQFQDVAWSLAFDLEYCRVRNPWSKPSVERAFRELDFLPTIKGKINKPIKNVLEVDPKKDAAMPFSRFCEGILKWVVDIHPLQVNQRKLTRPLDLFVEGLEMCPPPVFAQDLSMLDILVGMSESRTVGPGGIELGGLTYSSPDLLHVKRAIGPSFKAQIKWNPDDIGQIHLQNPKTNEWLTVPCTDQNYAAGMSWLQHKLVRKRRMQHFQDSGAYIQHEQAKRELIEMWAPAATGSRKKKLDAKVAAQFQGLSSNSAFLTGSPAQAASPEKVILTTKFESFDPKSIPDFDTYFASN